MASEATNQTTRKEWRELGFFYDRDDNAKQWRLVGSRSGLLRFRDLLLRYASDPKNSGDSEHEHCGPYMYLEVMTCSDAGFDSHAIRGTLNDLMRLADLIEIKLSIASPGSIVSIQQEYAQASEYSLVLEVRNEGFDPASADTELPPEAS